MTVTIFMADDHPLIMQGLQLLLESEPDLKVIGQVTDGRALVQAVVKERPDVVIADVTMPELNGIEAARRIREECPDTQVIMLSMHGTANLVIRALEAGANGYLIKGSASEEVVRAVRSVVQGRRFLSQKIAELVGENGLPHSETERVEDPLSRLSPREREVLQLVVEGNTNAKIAEKLSLSPKSIATYRGRIMRKLNMPDLPSLIKFALQQDLTPPQ
jgi:DNA-binding NarL/FixJ family response regulator